MTTTTEPTNAATIRGERVAREILALMSVILSRIKDTPDCYVTDALMELAQDRLPHLAGPWQHNVEGLGALAAGWWRDAAQHETGYEKDERGIVPDTAMMDWGSHARMVLRAGGAVADRPRGDDGLLLLCAAAIAVQEASTPEGWPSREAAQTPPKG